MCILIPLHLLALYATVTFLVRAEFEESSEIFDEQAPLPGCYHFSSEITDDTLYCIGSKDGSSYVKLQKLDVSELPAKLLYLSVAGNDIPELDSKQFPPSLVKLKKLVLTNNSIHRLRPLAFEELSSLESLDLSHNNFGVFNTVNIFLGLHKLQYLFIQYASITSIGPNVFAGLAGLKALDLTGNRLTQMDGGMFAGQDTLQYLALDYNKLTFVSPNIFNETPSIRTLYLDHNPSLTILPKNIFSPLSSLQNLTMSHTNISVLAPNVFSPTRVLSYLDLSSTPLTTDFATLLTPIQNSLRYLYISSTSITSWPNLQSLEHLDISHTSVEKLDDIRNLPSLRHLVLAGNSLQCTCEIAQYLTRRSHRLQVVYGNASCIGPAKARGSLAKYALTRCLEDGYRISSTDLVFILVGVAAALILLLLLGLAWGPACYERHVRNRLNQAAKTLVNGHTGVYVVEADGWNVNGNHSHHHNHPTHHNHHSHHHHHHHHPHLEHHSGSGDDDESRDIEEFEHHEDGRRHVRLHNHHVLHQFQIRGSDEGDDEEMEREGEESEFVFRETTPIPAAVRISPVVTTTPTECDRHKKSGVLPLNRQRSWLHGMYYRAIMTRLQRRYSKQSVPRSETQSPADTTPRSSNCTSPSMDRNIITRF